MIEKGGNGRPISEAPFENMCGPLLARASGAIAVLTIGCGCLFYASAACAAQPTRIEPIPTTEIFTLLFLMLGPFKIIGPFAKIIRGADPRLARQLTIRASLFSTFAMLLAAILGERILQQFAIPVPVLALTAGLILFLVAIGNILRQFVPPVSHGIETTAPTLNLAITPIAFPTIVTPYGIAALIVFIALSPDLKGKLIIGLMLLAIVLVNTIVMLLVRRMPLYLDVFLQIIGAVLGVIQVALGLAITLSSFNKL